MRGSGWPPDEVVPARLSAFERGMPPVDLDGRPHPRASPAHRASCVNRRAPGEHAATDAGSGRTRSASRSTGGCPTGRPGRARYARHPATPGRIWKQFTARDVVSRWDVARARSAGDRAGGGRDRSTPRRADAVRDQGHQHRQRLRVHGRVRDRLRRLGASPCSSCRPGSPKLHGAVERANDHTEEFYGLHSLHASSTVS